MWNIPATTRSYGSQDKELEVLRTHETWGITNAEESSLDGSTH